MALAETAELITRLSLQDQMSQGLKTAQGNVSRFGTGISTITKLGSGLGSVVSSAAAGIGNAFNTLKGRIGSLLTGPLGMLGLGAGIFSVVGFLKGGISQATDFAREVGRLASVTGLSTTTTSMLAGALHHFGIEADTALTLAGMAEKNIFKLGGTTAHATKFMKTYGFDLRDSSGHLKNFNELLLTSADYFNNKHIPAAQKDAALAAIFGRNWQALIPILSAGRKGISDAEEEAQKLGLTLTKDNLGALTRLKTATRDWGTALGGLKLQLGLAVVPLLTDLTNAATNFLTTTDQFGRTGSVRIIGFFRGLIDFGKQAYAVIETQVVPVVKRVIDGWNNLPAPLKSLLVRGAAGNFAIKFLLGFSPIGLAEQAAGIVAGKLAGLVAGSLFKVAANKLIPQAITAVAPLPVFVTNPGFGLPGGGGGLPVVPAAEAAGGLGALGLFGSAVLVAGLGAAAAAIAIPVVRQLTFNGTDPTIPGGSRGFFPGKGPADLQKYLDANSTAVKDNTDAILKGTTKGQLPGAPGGGHPAAAKPPERRLTDAQLILALSKTSEFGFAGVGTKIEHGPLTGTDPFGQQALALFRQAEFPQQGKTLGEIKRHIIAAQDAQRQFAAKGDTEAVRQLQATIDGLRRLLGSNQQAIQVARTNAFIHSGKLAAIDGRLGVIAAKDASIHITIPVTTNVTVGNVARTLNSYYIASKGSSSAFLSHTL